MRDLIALFGSRELLYYESFDGGVFFGRKVIYGFSPDSHPGKASHGDLAVGC